MSALNIPKFHWADYLVFGLSLASSAAIGFYFGFVGGKNKTTSDQLVAGRSLSAIPVSISALATLLSATFIIGIPGEIYAYGPMYSTIFMGYILCVPLTAFGFIPTFYNMKITSAYEYIEKRFNKTVQALSSILFAIMQLLFMAVSIYAPAVSFSQVTGLSEYITMLGLGVICTFYTAVGGMKAVIWTDVLQMTIILIGLIIIVVKGTLDAGGGAKVLEVCSAAGRLDFSEISIHPTTRHSWWTQTIGGCFVTMTNLTSNQAMIQRYISIRTLKEAKLCPIYMLLSVGVMLGLVVGLGWVMFAYYETCDPISSGLVKGDQLLPLFMMQVLSGLHGLPGLFTSAVFAATLSTLSSGVNAMAAVFLMDMIQPIYAHFKGFPLKEKTSSIITKVLAVVIGMACVGLAYVAPLLGSTLIQLTFSVYGMVGGPLLGLFTMAIFMPCVNGWGALAGLVSSLMITSWISVGTIIAKIPRVPLPLRQDGCPVPNTTSTIAYSTVAAFMDTTEFVTQAPDDADAGFQVTDFYKLSYMWYAALSLLVGVIVAIPVSYLTGGNQVREKRFYFDFDAVLGICGKSCWFKFDEKPSSSNESSEVQADDDIKKEDLSKMNDHARNGVSNVAYQDDEVPYSPTYRPRDNYYDNIDISDYHITQL